MNILFFSNYYYPHSGGVEKHIKCVSRELIAECHNVKLITIKHDNLWSDHEFIDGVEVIRRPDFVLPRLRYFQTLAWILTHWSIFAWADVFHGHDSYVSQLRYLFPNKKFVHTFHGYEGYPLNVETIQRRQWIAKEASAVVQVGDFIEKWYGTRPDLVIYGGVDLATKEPERVSNSSAVFIGRLEPDTGIKLYLDGVKTLNDRGIQLHVDICGDGSLRAQLVTFAVENKLDVTFHGMVTDVNKYLDKSQIAFVSGYLSILEALSREKNVVSVYENPLKYDYLSMMPHSDTFLSIVGSSSEVSDSIEYLLTNKEKAEKASRLAMQWANKQSWKKISLSYVELYNS